MNSFRVGRMMALCFVGCLVVAAANTGTNGIHGAGPNEQNPPAGSVEVRFANGSIVVMNLLQEKIEITTDYGKLIVPQRDIQLIDFGVRISDDDRRSINGSIQRLSSNSFREREDAVAELISQGPLAYAQLKSMVPADAESAKRFEEALRRLREKHHPNLLRSREDDVVRTVKFTIVGRITNPTIKARADEFGDLDLKPNKLLSMRWLAGNVSTEVTIDAAKYGDPNVRRWMDTGVQVNTHVGLKITAAGQVDTWPQQPGQYVSGPEGAGGPPGSGGRSGNGGALMGRIGEDGTPFMIGSRYTQTPKEPGKLYLQIVPSQWGGVSAGQYRVTIATGNFALDDD